MPVPARCACALWAMLRGSRVYEPPVIGSRTSHTSDSVGNSWNGSISAVLGSGTSSMSDSLISWKPRIDEPSKPAPSVSSPSLNSREATAKCCQVPGRSVNLRSTSATSWSRAKLTTSSGVGAVSAEIGMARGGPSGVGRGSLIRDTCGSSPRACGLEATLGGQGVALALRSNCTRHLVHMLPAQGARMSLSGASQVRRRYSRRERDRQRTSCARRRRRAEHRRRRHHGPEVPGLLGGVGGDRGAGAVGRVVLPPAPHRPRRDAARHGGLRRRAAPRRAARPRADHLPDRARRHRGQNPRAEPRRRRLRHQAVQPRGARRAHPVDPAPHRRGRARVEPPGLRGRRARRGRPRGAPRRRGGRPHGDRIPPAALPDAQPAPRPDPRAAARARLGLRLQRRRARARDLRQLPAQEARRSRPVAHPHRARRGLRPETATDMMASLRARLLAAVLALTACGLLLAGAITYVEQRSFQYSRVDQELKAAVIPVSGALEQMVGHEPYDHDGREPGRGPGGGPNFGIPAGTYGQKRDASGQVIADKVFSLNQTVTAKPALPAKLTTGEIINVNGRKGVDTRYRVIAAADPRDGTTTVVAIPLRATDDTLQQLLVVEALVIAGVLIVLGLVSWVVVRVGLLPLDRMGHTAGAIA